MKKSYLSDIKKIAPYVKLPFPKNKINLSSSEKAFITKTKQFLEKNGYYDESTEGYVEVKIKPRGGKIPYHPKIKVAQVNVGTKNIGGAIITDPLARVVQRDGRFYVTDPGGLKMFRFTYDVSRPWNKKTLAAHLNKKLGKSKNDLYFAIGAGLKYTVSEKIAPPSDQFEDIAGDIIKIATRYTSDFSEKYIDRKQVKKLSDWMQEIQVYVGKEVVINEIKNRKNRKKKKGKKRGRKAKKT